MLEALQLAAGPSDQVSAEWFTVSDAPDSQLVRTFLLQVVKSRIYLVAWQI